MKKITIEIFIILFKLKNKQFKKLVFKIINIKVTKQLLKPVIKTIKIYSQRPSSKSHFQTRHKCGINHHKRDIAE